MKKFKAGETVRIRDWDDMKKQFGLDRDGDIKIFPCFNRKMKSLCGKTAVVKSINNDGGVLLTEQQDINELDWDWRFNTSMIEHITREPSRKHNENGVWIIQANGEIKCCEFCQDDMFHLAAKKLGWIFSSQEEAEMNKDRVLIEMLETPDSSTKMKNFKVKCVKGCRYFEKGNVYEVIDGYIADEDGDILHDDLIYAIDDLNEQFSSKFELVKE